MKTYIVKRLPVSKLNTYNQRKEDEVLIAITDDRIPNIWLPSSYNHFLRYSHNNDSLNTKRKTAYILCDFLNHLNKQASIGENPIFENLETDGLSNLNLHHLEHYINYISTIYYKRSNKFTGEERLERLRLETVKEKESILFYFYEFLNKLGITGEEAKIERVVVPAKVEHKSKRARTAILSPFDNDPKYFIDYPPPTAPKDKNRVLKDMDEDVWNLFLDYADKYHKNIALALAFQLMGGIRLGEVVNLTLDAVEVFKEKNYIYLSIDDRQISLFVSRGVNTEYSQVKTPREDQPVFNFNGKLFTLWDKHIEYLKKNSKQSNTNALFINSYGQPMTGEVYQKEFAKLKFDFVMYLKDNYIKLFNELTCKIWGTHIGRHVYTNHLIKKGFVNNPRTGEPDLKLLMILRGDRSEDSSKPYIDVKTITQVVATQINIVSSIATQTINN